MAAGKTELVTIRGYNFPNSNYTQVSFSGPERVVAASQVVWLSSTELTCITPPFDVRCSLTSRADTHIHTPLEPMGIRLRLSGTHTHTRPCTP